MTANTPNLDDLMEEHLADKARLEELERKAKEEQQEFESMHWQAHDENARRDRIKARTPILNAIASHCRTHLEVVKRELSVEVIDGRIMIAGVNASYHLAFIEERTHQSSWRSSANGKTRLTTGDFGSKTSYPQKKDGSHSYDKIANDLAWYAVRELDNAERQRIVASRKDVVGALRAELKIRDYCSEVSLGASSADGLPVYVHVDFKKSLTVDQARQLVQTLKDIGLKLD